MRLITGLPMHCSWPISSPFPNAWQLQESHAVLASCLTLSACVIYHDNPLSAVVHLSNAAAAIVLGPHMISGVAALTAQLHVALQ